MYAQRYGTVPVVHATGGLKDSVIQYDPFAKELEVQIICNLSIYSSLYRDFMLYHGGGGASFLILLSSVT
jgi:hypothetical protein